MKGGSAHQLLPVWTRSQHGVQRYHRGVVAAPSCPAGQTEALVGLVPLSWTVRRGPDRGSHSVRDAPQVQVPVIPTKTCKLKEINISTEIAVVDVAASGDYKMLSEAHKGFSSLPDTLT